MNGNDLWGDCGGTATGPSPSLCRAYIMGASDSLLTASPARPYCIPYGVRSGQLTDVVRLPSIPRFARTAPRS